MKNKHSGILSKPSTGNGRTLNLLFSCLPRYFNLSSLCKKWQQRNTRNKPLGSIGGVLTTSSQSRALWVQPSCQVYIVEGRSQDQKEHTLMKPSHNTMATFTADRISEKKNVIYCMYTFSCHRRKLFPSISTYVHIHTHIKSPFSRLKGHSSLLYLKDHQLQQYLFASSLLPDDIFPILFFPTGESAHLLHFFNSMFILISLMWAQDRFSNSRKGNGREKKHTNPLPNQDAATSDCSNPPKTPNVHTTHWPPFSKMSGKPCIVRMEEIR